VGSVAAVFAVLFLGRLILAPAKLYWDQRRKVRALEDALNPRINVYFVPEELGTECVHHPSREQTCVRIVVVNTSKSVPLDDCQVHLESIYFRREGDDDFEWLAHYSPVNLSWSGTLLTADNEKYGATKLMPGERRPVDVIRSYESENEVYLLPDNPGFGLRWLSDFGTYRLRIVVFGEPSRPKEIYLDVDWSGDPGNLVVTQASEEFSASYQ